MCPSNGPPLYLVTDKRRDGRVRIIAEYVEPRQALEHARMLRWAGAPAEILVASAYDPNADERSTQAGVGRKQA